MRLTRFIAVAFLLGSIGAVPARAQCLEWDDSFFLHGADSAVYSSTVFDDGTGPALYIGGNFLSVADQPARSIAKWNGVSWSVLGTGTNQEVNALTVFDDGSGPALYAGGTFTTAGGVSAIGVAKWNGSSWSALGTGVGANVRALAVFDDGTGEALYAGGDFATAGGGSAFGVAKWNGTSWSALGLGTQAGTSVSALAVFDEGSGDALFVGGTFLNAGGMSATKIARWNGTAWSAVGTGITGTEVDALAVYDDGSGDALYVGGQFAMAGGNSATHIARWNGSAWSAVGASVNDRVWCLRVHDDGSGNSLFVGGEFTTAGGGGASQIAKWNGLSWSSVGGGTNGTVRTLAVFDDGAGAALQAGGGFQTAGTITTVRNIATWDGTTWKRLEPRGHAPDSTVMALLTFDDGSGSALYAGGVFSSAGNTDADSIARWDGDAWSPLGGGLSSPRGVNALALFDDGSGTALYAAGGFTLADGNPASRIAKWNGASWSALGSGMNATVRALAAFDDGSGDALYAGGDFTLAGGVGVSFIARWNGSSWASVGTGMNNTVRALAVHDDGSGAALYAAGSFTTADGGSAIRIARWNGTSWSSLGTGANLTVYALTVHDDGSGPALYAGGDFTSAGGNSAARVARWNGTTWSALGSGVGPGFNAAVAALETFDDGKSVDLYVSGSFQSAGGMSAARIAKWNGVSWSALGSGLSGFGGAPTSNADVLALASFDDGTGPALFAGGTMQWAGGTPCHYIARWRACDPGEAYCFGDGLDPVVTAQCPCTNFGAPGHGCANSIFPSGGKLSAAGTTSPNTILFKLTEVPNNALATGFRNLSNTNPGGVVFGDGVRCQSGVLIRFGAHNTGTLGDAPQTWTSPTDTITPGLTRYYQVQYRNPAPAFCPPATFNISNGYTISW